MTDPNKPAFSVGSDPLPEFRGLTKREYMATMLLAGILANSNISPVTDVAPPMAAVQQTDDLIKALNDG